MIRVKVPKEWTRSRQEGVLVLRGRAGDGNNRVSKIRMSEGPVTGGTQPEGHYDQDPREDDWSLKETDVNGV